jgi:hypothetical protein
MVSVEVKVNGLVYLDDIDIAMQWEVFGINRDTETDLPEKITASAGRRCKQ